MYLLIVLIYAHVTQYENYYGWVKLSSSKRINNDVIRQLNLAIYENHINPLGPKRGYIQNVDISARAV